MDIILKQAKQLIAEDQIESVIDLLSSHISSELVLNQLTILSARYKEYEENKLKGLVESNHYAEANKIRYALMKLITEVKRESKAVLGKPQKTSFYEKRGIDLKKRIESTFELLGAWEEKQSLAENPNEEKRCMLEIIRLNKLIEQYVQELNTL